MIIILDASQAQWRGGIGVVQLNPLRWVFLFTDASCAHTFTFNYHKGVQKFGVADKHELSSLQQGFLNLTNSS